MPTVDGLPYPNSSATPDVPGDILALVQAVSRKMGAGVAYAADSAGLAALVTDGLVKPGMLALQFDTRTLWFRETSTWVPAGQMMHPHAEFTATSANTATTTSSPIGTLAYDSGSSTSSTLVTGGASQITLNETGTYAIDGVGSIPVSPTGNTFLRFSDGVTQIGHAYGNPASGQWGNAMVSSFYAPAGTVLTFSWFHTSAASRVLTSRIKVTRIA